MAGRPKKINPNGNTKAVSIIIAQETYDALKTEAANRGISLGDIMRERLDAGIKVAG
ncbi:MAG: hypothetical protein ACO3VO_10775 [Ilumatobacteraceae bacterium]